MKKLSEYAHSILVSPQSKTFVDKLESSFPLIAKWHRFQYEEYFSKVAGWNRIFRGVYPSFQDAIESIPQEASIGYDNILSATCLGHVASANSNDYPVIYWLDKLLGSNFEIFDFGGYLGNSYYSYLKYLTYHPDLHWNIFDVPAVVAEGKRLAEEKGVSHLNFTKDFQEAEHASLFLAFGSLQFPEQTLIQYHQKLKVLPRHLLLNKTPLWDGETFYTVHNMGPSLMPYRISNRSEFIGSLTSLGLHREYFSAKRTFFGRAITTISEC